MHTPVHHNSEKHHSMLGFAVAAAIATGLGLYARSKMSNEMKEDIKEKASKIAKKFKKTREDVQTMVHNSFGKVSEDLEEDYLNLQGHLMADVDELKGKGPLNREKYENLVDKTVEKFSKGRDWSSQAVKNLGKNLKKDWKAYVE